MRGFGSRHGLGAAVIRACARHVSWAVLYVALGRVTDPDNLRVVAPRTPGNAVINVVYKDVLEVGEARCR